MRRFASLALMLLVLASACAALPAVTHADGGVTVSIRTIGKDTENALGGACYQIIDASNVGCDVNRDGQVDFQDVHVGTYNLVTMQAPAGYELYRPDGSFDVTQRDGGTLYYTVYFKQK